MITSQEKMIALCQGQLDAYNARDLVKFASFYHPDVTAYRLSNSEPILKGLVQLRSMYGKRFSENPQLHCELRSRIILAETVLDEEWVTGVVSQQRPAHVVALYKFKDDRIHSIWFTS